MKKLLCLLLAVLLLLSAPAMAEITSGNDAVIAHCSDILQIRFIEETYDLIHVQIVRDENAKMSREEIETYVSSNLNKIFKKPFEFEFEWLDAIPPDPNGKLRMIVSKVKPGA